MRGRFKTDAAGIGWVVTPRLTATRDEIMGSRPDVPPSGSLMTKLARIAGLRVVD